MPNQAVQALAAVLRPLSALLKVPLEIDNSNGTVSRADGQPLIDAERELLGEVLYLIGASYEVHALEERIASLEFENIDLIGKISLLTEFASRDALTGLYNRRYVVDKIDAEINRAVRHGYPMSLMMVDIDNFTQINASFGREEGDRVLKSVGQVLRDSCRMYDVPGRYAGEEFCIVLPETRVAGTSTVAERIRARVAAMPIHVGDSDLTLTASIGVAGMDSIAEDGMLSAGALLDRADRAMNAAKSRGRNRVELWQ
jgi:diguanylate cyclase (GGDEF)-like protein